VETRKKTNPRFAFKKGDTVQISHVRQPFDREYDEHWTMEYFVVADRRVKEGLPYYTLKDMTGEAIHESPLGRTAVSGFVSLRYSSWGHLDRTMIASVVALHHGIQDVDPTMRLMTGHVTAEFRFDRLDGLGC
jgi:hypothetical protein